MVQTNNLGSQSHHVWRRRRNVLLLLLACGIVAVYVAIPPSGIEYNLAGFLTIREGQSCERSRKICIRLRLYNTKDDYSEYG